MSICLHPFAFPFCQPKLGLSPLQPILFYLRLSYGWPFNRLFLPLQPLKAGDSLQLSFEREYSEAILGCLATPVGDFAFQFCDYSFSPGIYLLQFLFGAQAAVVGHGGVANFPESFFQEESFIIEQNSTCIVLISFSFHQIHPDRHLNKYNIRVRKINRTRSQNRK